MFLLYRNHGVRYFGREPIHPYPRYVWEFQFTIDGKNDFLIRENGVTRSERLTGPVLSVTGPECVHGWAGRPEDRCHSMIFHFDEADFALRTVVGPGGHRHLRFSTSEIPALEILYDRCAEARRAVGTTPPEVKKRAGMLEPLIYRVVADELTLFVLKHIPKSELGPAPNFGEGKINEAMAWYEANLAKGPTIADVARAIHLSTTHLRRLFHKIRGISPQNAFTQVQFERVKWLMRDPEMTLDRIAENSGFGSASAFSRAFKAEFRVSPKSFRNTLQKS